jgi:cobalt-zinc-cadmium efflux system protein
LSHSHQQQPPPSSEKAASKLTIALVITASFMVVEAVGGFLTGSLALLADAGHMLSDAGALAVALLAARLATRPPDSRQTMGYQRAEVLGAGLNAGALVVLAIWIAFEAIGRFSAPPEVLAKPMMLIAILGLIVNLGIFKMLSGHGHSHGHGHGHSQDINTRAVMLHVLGDALGSVGALTAGGLILWRGWAWADPTASILIACIILFGAQRVLREVLSVLMQAAPPDLDIGALQEAILEIEGVYEVHDLNAWVLRPGEDVVSVHVVLCEGADAALTCAQARDTLAAKLESAHITVQPEPLGSSCRPSAASG